MKCTNCGANFEDGARECPFCGSAVHMELSFEQSDTNHTIAIQTTLNPLLDKEYNFSGNDIAIRGRWGINVNVKVGADRLFLQTLPARKNVLPAIMLEDIMAIQNKFHLRTANIVVCIIGLLCGFSGSIWGFLISIIILLCYRERKIQIYLRNGNILTIYSSDKELASQFIEDMKQITNIKQ